MWERRHQSKLPATASGLCGSQRAALLFPRQLNVIDRLPDSAAQRTAGQIVAASSDIANLLHRKLDCFSHSRSSEFNLALMFCESK